MPTSGHWTNFSFLPANIMDNIIIPVSITAAFFQLFLIIKQGIKQGFMCREQPDLGYSHEFQL